VLALKASFPAHQGTLDEVQDRVTSDLKKELSVEQAKSKADELVRRIKGGEKFAAAAKALGLDPKTSDSISQDGSISGAASGKQLSTAFKLKQGDRKSTRLNSSHGSISYAVFCLKKKKTPAIKSSNANSFGLALT